MKKVLFLYSVVATNLFAGLDGTWEGICESAADNPRGTYNYWFNNGQVETFLQYYRDQTCAPQNRSTTVPQAQGSYQVLSAQVLSNLETYEVMMNYGHGPESYRLVIENETMKVCQLRPYSCWSYKRR